MPFYKGLRLHFSMCAVRKEQKGKPGFIVSWRSKMVSLLVRLTWNAELHLPLPSECEDHRHAPGPPWCSFAGLRRARDKHTLTKSSRTNLHSMMSVVLSTDEGRQHTVRVSSETTTESWRNDLRCGILIQNTRSWVQFPAPQQTENLLQKKWPKTHK